MIGTRDNGSSPPPLRSDGCHDPCQRHPIRRSSPRPLGPGGRLRALVRALVTGAGGFVGPHLVRHLTDSGDSVVALDLRNGPDLRDRIGWRDAIAEHGPDVIYHLAGWSDVGGSWLDPWTTFEVNVMGTVAILEAARVGGMPRVVLISSADVYGLVEENELPLTEEAALQPRSPYGASKQAAENVAISYWRAHKLPVLIARPFNHLGRGQAIKFAAASFAGQIARLEMDGGGILRHGDLSSRRDMTDVHDIVRAYRLLALHGEPGETYNICSGRSVSMQSVLETLLSLSPSDIRGEVDHSLIRPIDLPVLQGSHDKLSTATGWKPNVELAQTLRDVLDDARSRLQRGADGGDKTVDGVDGNGGNNIIIINNNINNNNNNNNMGGPSEDGIRT